LEETFAVHRLKLPGLLRGTLASTNAMESANPVYVGILKLFCKSFWPKCADKAKKGALAIGDIALTVVSVFLSKGKFKSSDDI